MIGFYLGLLTELLKHSHNFPSYVLWGMDRKMTEEAPPQYVTASKFTSSIQPQTHFFSDVATVLILVEIWKNKQCFD